MNIDSVTTPTAVAAVVSPFWLPDFHSVSAGAAEVLPILGAIWLMVQIITKVLEMRRRSRR